MDECLRVKQVVQTLDESGCSVSTADFIEMLQTLQNHFPNETLQIEAGVGYGYADERTFEFEVFYMRPETDDERAKRARQEEAHREQRRNLLARLKKELGED